MQKNTEAVRFAIERCKTVSHEMYIYFYLWIQTVKNTLELMQSAFWFVSERYCNLNGR